MTNQHQQPRAVAILVIATCFAALLAFASADCSVRIEQTLGSSWVADGVPTSQWNARIVSTGSETVTSLQLAIGGANPINQLWELDPVPGASRLYALPAYVSGLSTGQVYNWGYIWQSAAQAPVTVSSIQCGGGPAPSASSSPAAASPSASPSIVATPAPCQLSILQSTRGAGGSWTEGDRFFQIYDLNLLNSGSSAITAAVIAIDLAPNQQQTITQFWNLERQSATSNLFNVRNPGGNIEVGATLGAGIVVSSPISAGPQVPPTTRVVSVSCVGGSPQPSAPASPSPSSGASPSATPASGCRAQLAIVARSAAAGGSWTTGPNQFFQIFDIQITNNGQRPVNGGVITFNLPVAGSTITQWWELNRQGSTNVFNVAFNYGPLQVGASQGAGIVVETSSPSQAVPSALLSNIACA